MYDQANIFEIMFSKNITFLLIFTISFIFAWYLKFRWSRRRLYELMQKIRQPPGHPIFGYSFKLMGSANYIFKTIQALCTEYGPNCGVWLGHVPVVVVGKPEDVEIVLQSQHCISKSFHYRFTEMVVGQGLFSAPVEKWKKTRKLIQPTFNTRILENFVQIFSETGTICVKEILPKYVNKKEVDWYSVFTALNLDTISQTAMGLNTDAQRKMFQFSEHLQTVMKLLFLRFFNVFTYPDIIFKLTKNYQQMIQSTKYMNYFTDTIVRKKTAEFQRKLKETSETFIDEAPTKRKVFLEMLLEINNNGSIFNEKELRDEVITLFVGGTDTSAVTSCFFLTMMGMHPEIQEKVYEEIIDVLGTDRTPEPADLQRLNLLERCLKETMRLFTPAPFIARKLIGKEIELSDMTVPDGVIICMMFFYIHRSENFWEDPLKFDPDRFLPENFSKKHPYSFVPFSGGLRGCIGMRYSYMNLKTILSLIVRRYKVYCDYKTIEEIEIENYIVIKPIHGFKFHLEERK